MSKSENLVICTSLENRIKNIILWVCGSGRRHCVCSHRHPDKHGHMDIAVNADREYICFVGSATIFLYVKHIGSYIVPYINMCNNNDFEFYSKSKYIIYDIVL